METLKVIAHPIDRNNFNAFPPKLNELKGLLNYASHDPLLIRNCPKITPAAATITVIMHF